MILACLWSGVVYIAGAISGVYLREHDVLTVADIRKAADKLIASAPTIHPSKTVPDTQTNN